MKKQLVYGLAAAAIVLFGIGGYVFAQQGPFGGEMGSAICERFAERFNLDVEEVEVFFAEQREENRAEAQERAETRMETRLDGLVESGEITREQKLMIQEKREEMQKELEGLSFEERRERMQELNQEMNSWAEENGIELEFLGMPGGFGRGFRTGPGPMGPCPERDSE